MKIWLLFLFTLISICSLAQSKFTVHAYNSKGQEYLSSKTPKSMIDSILIVKIRMDDEVTSESMFIVDEIKFTIHLGAGRNVCSIDIKGENGKFSIKSCYQDQNFQFLLRHGAIVEVMKLRRITTSREYKTFRPPALILINVIKFEGED